VEAEGTLDDSRKRREQGCRTGEMLCIAGASASIQTEATAKSLAKLMHQQKPRWFEALNSNHSEPVAAFARCSIWH
jgi:hypothetical protein